MRKYFVLIIFLGFIGMVAFSLVRNMLRDQARDQTLAPFRPHLNEYLMKEYLNPMLPTQVSADAKYHGKMIVLNQSDFDNLYFRLPDSLAAKSPEEVGMVVLLFRDYDQVGTYNTGTKAFVQTCKVTVVDKDSKKVFATRLFKGGDPPLNKKSTESGTGSSPDEDIVRYLTNLH